MRSVQLYSFSHCNRLPTTSLPPFTSPPWHHMHPKQRIPEEATPAPLAPPRHHSHASKIPATNTEVNLKPEPCAPKILWDLNKHWTDRLIEYLSDNLDVQLKMFSDSIKDARKESHRKVSNLMFWFFCCKQDKVG